MIIVGYQCIGKSTLCNKIKDKYIDLESGNFFVDGKRDDNWYKVYVNIANHLSSQGCIVFTSSHEVVREELRKSGEPVFIIHPSLRLKDAWLAKLKNRYEQSGLDKDYRAWKNAETGYDGQIQSLIDDPIPNIEINVISYELECIIMNLRYPDTPTGRHLRIYDTKMRMRDVEAEYLEVLRNLAARIDLLECED